MQFTVYFPKYHSYRYMTDSIFFYLKNVLLSHFLEKLTLYKI